LSVSEIPQVENHALAWAGAIAIRQ